jgi:hypothetical protein
MKTNNKRRTYVSASEWYGREEKKWKKKESKRKRDWKYIYVYPSVCKKSLVDLTVFSLRLIYAINSILFRINAIYSSHYKSINFTIQIKNSEVRMNLHKIWA